MAIPSEWAGLPVSHTLPPPSHFKSLLNAAGNHSDLSVASFQYDILLCSETFFSDMRYVSEILVVGFDRPVLLCWGKMPRTRGMAAYVRGGYRAFCQPKFECGCCEMLVFRVCGVRQNLCVQSLLQP